jgi:predicted dehydrogenase
MALAAVSAKKHILCEKPLAPTVEEATQMIEAAQANGVKLYVAENEVYTSMSATLREIVETGQHIGQLTCAAMTKGFRAPDFGYAGRRSWLTSLEAGGTGTWMLHGIHSMAQLRYIFGEVETVYVGEHKTDSFNRRDLEGTVSGLLTLANGCHISIVQSSETRLAGAWGGYVMHGDQGSLRAWNEAYEVYQPAVESSELKRFAYPEESLSSYAREIEAFADYVAGQAVGPTTAESERRSLAIVQAGYESMQNGQPVRLSERFGNI